MTSKKKPTSATSANAAHQFDLIVIGSGPAGQRAAMQGAKAGKRVAVIERYEKVGGACVHWGTIPSKSFRESVYRFSLGSRGVLGQDSEGRASKDQRKLPDLKRLLRRRDRVIRDEANVIQHQLGRNGISVYTGEATLVGKAPGRATVQVTQGKKTHRLEADYVILAVGSSPVSPPHIPIDGKLVHDSDTILEMKQLPRSLCVLGAGIIGCEYASMFSIAGTRVTLVDRRDTILASVDREIVSHLVERFEHDRAEVLLKEEATSVEIIQKRGRKMARVRLSSGKKLDVDAVLVSLGRGGNTAGLGLEGLGIEVDSRGQVKVDPQFRTNVPNIYAVGDVVGAPALAATSYEQGRIACAHAFQLQKQGVAVETQMPELFPYGIYTIPEISMIGKTEEELKTAGIAYVVGRSRYRELARGQIVGDRWGLLKLLVDAKTLKLHGVHIIGDNAADLIHIGQAVMAFDGDVNYFIRSVFNYPTLAEAYKTAAFHAFNTLRGLTRS